MKRFMYLIIHKLFGLRNCVMYSWRNEYYFVDCYGDLYNLKPTEEPGYPFIIICIRKA